MTENEGKSSIQVIARMMSLIDALARHSAPVNLKSLATETELHPSTAHRILNVMVQYRMVDRVEPGQYQLGMRLFELGTLVRARISICHEALPYMQQLQQLLGETVSLSVRHDDEVVYVERASSAHPAISAFQTPGGRVPLHTTAVGKIFLAADGPEKCLEYARRTGLPRFTEHTLTDHVNLLKQLEEARRQGYAFDQEEAAKGVACVGTGIYDREGRLIAALSVSAPAERFNKGWASQVKQTSERISRALGNPSPNAPPTTAS